jgi:hypothetical protein
MNGNFGACKLTRYNMRALNESNGRRLDAVSVSGAPIPSQIYGANEASSSERGLQQLDNNATLAASRTQQYQHQYQ